MAASPPRYGCHELTVVYNPYCNEQKHVRCGRTSGSALQIRANRSTSPTPPVLAVALNAKSIAET
jgi:hypothetical protein